MVFRRHNLAPVGIAASDVLPPSHDVNARGRIEGWTDGWMARPHAHGCGLACIAVENEVLHDDWHRLAP